MATRTARVEIFRDRRGEYRWRLLAGNGEVVATGEAHGSPRDAKRSWLTVERLVVVGAGDDEILPLPMTDLTKARRAR